MPVLIKLHWNHLTGINSNSKEGGVEQVEYSVNSKCQREPSPVQSTQGILWWPVEAWAITNLSVIYITSTHRDQWQCLLAAVCKD